MRVYRLPARTAEPNAQARADAHARALAEHPDASRVLIVWTPASEREFHAEVWQGQRAVVVPV